MLRTNVLAIGAASLLLGLAVTGCGSKTPEAPPTPQASKTPAAPKLQDVGPITAGLLLSVPPNPQRWKNLIAAHHAVTRPDPFQLTPIEQGFEVRQTAERLVLTQSGFSDNFGVSMPEAGSNVIFEPQPYRRLAGVLIGESVLAIIDMGDGRPAEIIRPGQRISGTPWTVVSIDADKAVLRRGGNVLPREVIVRLESNPNGTPASAPNPATNGGFPNNPGNPGFPGNPGGGGRGGGGRRGGGGA